VLPPNAAPAVEAAASGLVALDPRDLEVLLAGAAPAHRLPETAALTAREIEVLRMMAEGTANKNIAWKLGISERTVKFHVASILGKLNASSRPEAVTTGIRKGLILI
jgi:DNA-binding NarL/FixJ family response regulator